jgi:phosphotransferase system HPr (HPr) family protein
MQFVDLASTFGASVRVTNLSASAEQVDGKSAMQMMLLEATKGSILLIQAQGSDAQVAVDALAELVEHRIGRAVEGSEQASE